jgi:hypothetical protein
MQATYPAAVPSYPLRVEGELGEPSRWLWLVKWLLALPHFLVLAALWPAFVVSSAAAFVAVLFTGRYPRPLFDFNVGVMRWSWRVAFYAYAANGTDLYPPFTLADASGYPARLEIAYPEHQRRGLALIGWWLAGAPQYLIAFVFIGAGVFGWAAWVGGASWGGLIGLLVLVGLVVLLFRGVYPRSIFDLVLGLDRWVLRVVAYAAVMTPEYPPFRLDVGEADLAGGVFATPSAGASTKESQPEPARWSAARILAAALACVATLAGIAAILAGATGIVFDQTQRGDGGYLMSAPAPYSTGTYALDSAAYSDDSAGRQFLASKLLGTIRIRAHSSRPVFLGIAPTNAANAYLAGVAHAEGADLAARSADLQVHPGSAPSSAPRSQRFWVASTTGAGTQTLSWKVRRGSWRVVVMNADGTRNVSTDLSIGASAPHLLTIGILLLGVGILVLLMGCAGLYLIVRGRR